MGSMNRRSHVQGNGGSPSSTRPTCGATSAPASASPPHDGVGRLSGSRLSPSMSPTDFIEETVEEEEEGEEEEMPTPSPVQPVRQL